MSAANTFTGARLDRAGDARRRDPEWLAAQRESPAARALLASDDGIVMERDRLAFVPLAEAAASAALEPLLLGIDTTGPLFAFDLDAPPAVVEKPPRLIAAGMPRGGGAARLEPAEGARPVPLRAAAAVLPQDEGGLVAYVASLCNWHRSHRFCAACGAETQIGEAGLIRACPRCGTEHHPRTDPVVIMLVTDTDRVVLGRAPSWPPRRYSALAGYVEPGESLEEAVAREVAEESGVEIGTPGFVASQPWSFPSTLMLGFEAPWRAGEPRPLERDVEDVRWFSREEVARAAAEDADGWGGEPDAAPDVPLLLPPRLAIARRLVERWLAA